MRMRLRILGVAGAVALALRVSTAAADVINVPADQPTIKAAIDAAAAGDEIVVADGVYSGPGNRDMKFSGKPLTLRSANGSERCIIDCQFAGRAFTFGPLDTRTAVLDGLTIRNGLAPDGTVASFRNTRGGAIICRGGSPMIRNCVFDSNHALFGGAIAIVSGSPTIVACDFLENAGRIGGVIYVEAGTNHPMFERCRFAGNMASSGGAAFIAHFAAATFLDCEFRGNAAINDGGALVATFSEVVVLINCLVVENSAGQRGAAFSLLSYVSCHNCTISGNTGPSSAGTVWLVGISGLGLTNSIMWDNPAGSVTGQFPLPPELFSVSAVYSTVENAPAAWLGTGSITADPLFVNPAAGDYRLLPRSPCIDAGNNALVPVDVTTDLAGNPRIADGDGDGSAVVDMGAYELPRASE